MPWLKNLKESNMSIPGYCKELDRNERASALKLGMLMKAAEYGQSEQFMKTALVDVVTSNIIRLSILAGIPIGVAASLVHNKVKEDNLKEKELETTANYYRSAAKNFEQGMTHDDKSPTTPVAPRS